MHISTNLNKLAVIVAVIGLSACGDREPSPGTSGDTTQVSREQSKADWGIWPQHDPSLTCAGSCGQIVFDPTAWVYCGCDDTCTAEQDCCADEQQLCDAPPATTCDYAEPDRKWATQDWATCPAVRIGCEAGWRPFQEPGCGCGCEQDPLACDYSDPNRDWVSKDWSKCLAARIGCDAATSYFEVPGCGCGCEQTPTPTCDYADPKRDYYAQQPGGCAAMLIACAPGWELFDDACGCGCEDRVPDCIRALIQQLESEPVANPPASITLYEYNGQSVYFLPQRCCDIPSKVYDAQCTVICEPDGGFSGAGDGRCPDFFQAATDHGPIWQDPR